jgi:DNA-binding transcriptional MerR regulator
LGSSPELVKLYYRIGEVAQIVGVQPHVLRYWETEFRTIRPQKSHKGQRVYSRRDVEKLLKVKDLLKNQGFTIAGAKKKLRVPELDAPQEEAIAPAVSLAPSIAAPVIEPVIKAAPVSPLAPAANRESRTASNAKIRDALLSIRVEIAAMLTDIDSPPRRPKLPTRG